MSLIHANANHCCPLAVVTAVLRLNATDAVLQSSLYPASARHWCLSLCSSYHYVPQATLRPYLYDMHAQVLVTRIFQEFCDIWRSALLFRNNLHKIYARTVTTFNEIEMKNILTNSANRVSKSWIYISTIKLIIFVLKLRHKHGMINKHGLEMLGFGAM